MSAIELYGHASSDFDAKLAETQALLQRVGSEFSPLALACSLGAEDMVLVHLLHRLGTKASIFVLETGKLHTETLALIVQIESRYGFKLDLYRPQPGAGEAFEQANEADAMYKSQDLRKACCGVRKMEPLARALAGKKAWITGLRREQSQARAQVEFIEADGPERHKVNPLARWTTGDVWHYIVQQGIPYNALHDRFFPSIGCAPCTRAVTLGEDLRSGRWWWESESAKECGLHVKDAAVSIIAIKEVAA
jgi:phosphoadenosine phosphosulfate reductase